MGSGYPFAALTRALAEPEPPRPARRRPRHRATGTPGTAPLTSAQMQAERRSPRHRRGLRLVSLLHRRPARTAA